MTHDEPVNDAINKRLAWIRQEIFGHSYPYEHIIDENPLSGSSVQLILGALIKDIQEILDAVRGGGILETQR